MAIDTGSLNSLYKIAYAKGVEDLIPKASKLSDMIPFVASELQNGKHYEQPVVLTAEAGFTYSLDTQNAYDLNDSIGMSMASAVVPGADIVLDSTVGYNQAARASHSATSFKSVMSTKFENMLKSAEKRLEVAMLYGGKGIAQSSAVAQNAVDPTTKSLVTISASDWATGIFAGSENAEIQFYNAGSLVSSGADAIFKIVSVKVDTRQLVVSGSTTGSSAIVALTASPLDVFFRGSNGAEMAGLQKIITNTGSLFGIDAAQYDLWKGNSVTTSGPLTMAKVLSSVSKAVQRGLDSDVVCLVNPSTWADLASNLAALRRFDGSYSKKKASSGSEELEYIGQNGVIKIVAYNIVKEGHCFIFPEDKVMRIGARELGLNDPTRPQDEIFFTIPGKAGVGLRAYTNQAIFLEAPAQAVFISGIQNSI